MAASFAQTFQFPPSRLTNSDNVRTGNAASTDRVKLGIPLDGAEAQAVRVLSLGAPAAADSDGAAKTQAVGAGASFTLDGDLVSSGVAVFDVPRNVVAAWTTTSILTITGYDLYGNLMVEVSASGTSHTGKKAFKRVTSVTSSASITAATVGTGSVLGLPYRPVQGGFIRGRLNEDSSDAGTYAAPERSASTGTTNDVRGTYAPAGTLNGTNVFTVAVAVQNGPSDSDAFGIAQYQG